MNAPRLLQVLAFLFVTFVMIRSYVVSDMLFQFGGLLLGMVVFAVGRSMESRQAG